MQHQPRILIVDDSAIIRKALANQMKIFGARTTEAEDGEKAWKTALHNDFDLIITDVEMPELDGFGLCRRLKNHARTRGIPVIILSSLDTDKDIEMGFNVGAAAYVSKAEAHLQLNATIEKVLKQSRFSRSRSILVVDDSSTIRGLVSAALEKAGFQVVKAENGKIAFDLLRAKHPDLIISDINMPEMDGIELCKKTHADPDLAVIPFVVMSANSDRAVMRRMLSWGASGYLVKPFNLDQIVITVERLLSDQFLILLKEKERLDTEQKIMLAGITSLIAALEARDSYTRGHSEAVAMISVQIAQQMNINTEAIDALRIAGKLHDIGKIGVPDSILLKPDRLNKNEYTILQKHPVIGSSILGTIPSIQQLIPVILQHHERFDGKGYPSGLKGEEIMLWARIAAVADTYHALTSDRPYRKGISPDEAMCIIDDVRGTQLCPVCVDAFLNLSSFELRLCSF
ncbi:MAG: response regulator [Syntrophaceae bacterium]|nr:response regulator [Syntrophaceae bacterium]HQM46085.1 response regulator [Smithellaceae bacterium]